MDDMIHDLLRTGGGGRGRCRASSRRPSLQRWSPQGQALRRSRRSPEIGNRDTMTSADAGGRFTGGCVTRCFADVPKTGQLGAGVALRRAGARAASRVVVRLPMRRRSGVRVSSWHAEHRIVAGVEHRSAICVELSAVRRWCASPELAARGNRSRLPAIAVSRNFEL